MMDAIFFDLDGTLTDPKPGITRSIRYALQKLDHPAIPSEDELTWCIGPPLRASFVRLLGAETSADHAVSLYRERFSDVGLFENAVYDGIDDVLTALGNSGHRLFVATSKPHVFADRIIDHFGLRHHFERVFGSELDGTRVDKGDLLEYALNEAAVDPSADPDDRRSQPRHGRRQKQWHGSDRRALRLRQQRRTDRGRRFPRLRHARGDPRLHFLISVSIKSARLWINSRSISGTGGPRIKYRPRR